jgi:hypothetical protein
MKKESIMCDAMQDAERLQRECSGLGSMEQCSDGDYVHIDDIENLKALPSSKIGNVFALYEVSEYEDAHMVDLFSTKKGALKSGLALRRKMVQQHLDNYRTYGWDEAEYNYRHCWDDVKLCVEEVAINE